MSDPNMSAQPCGCDPGAKWVCSHHMNMEDRVDAVMRTTQQDCASTGDSTSTSKAPVSGGASPGRSESWCSKSFTYGAGTRLRVYDCEREHGHPGDCRSRLSIEQECHDAEQTKIDRHADALIRAHQANLLVVNKKLEQGTPTLPKGQKPTNAKGPFATNKVPLSLVPSAATALCALALADGGAKYGIANYRAAGVSARIYIDALMRHIAAWYDGGEDVADDSSVPHLGHAMACLAILIDAETHGVLTDDRPMSNTGLAKLMEQSQAVVSVIRSRHADKHPRHYTIKDNGIGTVPDPKTRG